MLSALLLDWYRQNGRELPWRVKGGPHPAPYAVLVSEFMLQQTTVKTVIPYFERFMSRFPSLEKLAEASVDDVYQYWQGLGYYTRARSLHQTARILVQDFHSQFPQNRQEILKLKGIGAYTASSLLALAFNQPETVIDGNVMRIICRLNHWTMPVDEIKDKISIAAAELTDKNNPADYASAIMDLGAVVCTPKNPKCGSCPWQRHCKSKNAEDLEQIPLRRRLPKPLKNGFVYIIQNSNNDVSIQQRHGKGLLSGLYEFPWAEQALYPSARDTGQSISHIFTHFKLTLQICALRTDSINGGGEFIKPENLKDYPVSTLMKKVFNKYNQTELQLFDNS